MQEDKRTSVKDIAARLNISLSTVHKALTGKPGISEARRRQVIAAAEEMGYVVNTVAQSLARKSFHLGIVLPSQWQEFFLLLKAGIEAQLQTMVEYKVTGIFYALPSDPAPQEAERLRNWLYSSRVDAVLYCASNHRLNALAGAVLSGVEQPVFWVGGSSSVAFSAANITVDASLTGKLAADFLCTATGCVQAAVFTGSMENDIHREKVEAFCLRIAANGGTVLEICQTEDDPARTASAVAALLNTHPGVNAIYVSTSTSAPVCAYLQAHGYAGKIRLLGTDVFDTLQTYIQNNTMQATISQNPEEVGKLAVTAAYEYLHRTNSYGNTDWIPQRLFLVKPSLLLKANLE